jgi:Bacterial Ig-like domain (group 3)
MPSRAGASGPRRNRRARWTRPCVLELEPRVVLSQGQSQAIPGLAGVAVDTAGDVFVSYNSTPAHSSTPEESIAAFNLNYDLLSGAVFTESGASATPGDLNMATSSDSLPNVATGDILELQPNGQLFAFALGGAASPAANDNLASYAASESNVYDVQTGSYINLSDPPTGSPVDLADATFGDFGVDGSSLVVSAEANDWDFVMRVTYGTGVPGTATILVASPASDGLTASPGGVAVDPQGTVLTTLPYLPSGSTTAIHVPVGFNLFFDQGSTPTPYLPALGLSSVPNIDSSGITVDGEDNFILAVTKTSLYGGGPGVAHINSSLTAFLADPTTPTNAIPQGISYQEVDGTNYLVQTYPDDLGFGDDGTFTISFELSLFSGQVSPEQLRAAYGINEISFNTSNGTVAGTGAGQTIAIVEDGIDPTLEADLETFDAYFGIPNPPSFQVINQSGATDDTDIVGEASLDVEWAHAIAPDASIIVYNADNNAGGSIAVLADAMNTVSLMRGVSVVTLSYDEAEIGVTDETSLDSDFTTAGVTFLAASGDSGAYLPVSGDSGGDGDQVSVNYPAASPDVVSVGGTSIVIDPAGDYPGTGENGETGWGFGSLSGSEGGSGGGLSTVEPEPSWQLGVVPTSIDSVDARAVPDVAMDSGAAQEYDVFTSTVAPSSDSGLTDLSEAVGWLGDAGTSAASPIWAGLIAIADQGRALEGGTPLTGYTQTLPALYSLPGADFNDIVSGNNGYAAGQGYDLVTGRGTPIANLLVPALASYGLPSTISVVNPPPTSVVAGQPFGFSVNVRDSQGNPVDSGTVTVSPSVDPGGAPILGTLTVPITDGTATFSGLSIDQVNDGYTLTATVTGTSVSTTAGTLDVTAPTSPYYTQVAVSASPGSSTFGQSVALTATVSSIGGSMPTGTVTFEDGSTDLGQANLSNGTASIVITPASAGTETITVIYPGGSNDRSSTGTHQLTVAKATPTLSWATPAGIVAGAALGAAQLDATAAFDGSPLAGSFVFSPAQGAILPAGEDVLTVTFDPANTSDFTSVTTSVSINVAPAPQPNTIVGESPVFTRKKGKSVVTGFSFNFSQALNTASATNPAIYEIDAVVIEKVKKKQARVLHPLTNFTVAYHPDGNTVTLDFTKAEKFANGGQITVLNGVTAGSGLSLSGTTVFRITAGGRRIVPE